MADQSNKLNLLITGDGEGLRKELGRGEREIKSWGQRVGRSIGNVHRSINSGLKRMITSPFTGLVSAGAIAYAGKQIIDFDAKLMRLGIQGGKTGTEMTKMRQDIINTALATGQIREEVLAGIDAIVERTGDIRFADEIKKQMGIAATASGAAMTDIGALSSNLNQKLGIKSGAGIMEALNLLHVQGKAGAFTLSNMASMGERLFAALGNIGGSGMEDLKKFGALLQVARMGTGSSEQATTAVERILANIIAKQDQIKKLGFDVFEDRELKKFKSVDELLKGIIKASKGDQKILGQIFGEEGIRGVSTLAKLYRETGGFDLYDKIASADANRAGELMNDFSRYSTSAAFQMARLREIGKKFADKSLSKSIADITDGIKDFLSNKQAMSDFDALARGLGGSLDLIAKTLIFSAGGWGKLFGVYEKGMELLADKLLMTDKKGLQSAGFVAGFNTLPLEERKRRIQQLETTGKMSLKNENNINLSVSIDSQGNVRSHSNDLNTKLNTTVLNRGIHRAAQ